jgi:chromosome segregation ATPase
VNEPVTNQELWEMFDRVSAAIRTSHSQLSETIKQEVGELKTQLDCTRSELSGSIKANQERMDAIEKDLRTREETSRAQMEARILSLGKEVTDLRNQVAGHDESIRFYKRVAYGAIVMALGALITFGSILFDHALG